MKWFKVWFWVTAISLICALLFPMLAKLVERKVDNMERQMLEQRIKKLENKNTDNKQ